MDKFCKIWSHYSKVSIILTFIINRDVLATECHEASPQPISPQASFVHGQLVVIVDNRPMENDIQLEEQHL